MSRSQQRTFKKPQQLSKNCLYCEGTKDNVWLYSKRKKKTLIDLKKRWHAKRIRWTMFPQALPDQTTFSVPKANQTKQHMNPKRTTVTRWRGKGGKTKRGWKPCRTVPWHLSPGCCLFWTAQRQIVLQDRDYWPLGHYHLNFPWCTPANREQGIKLNYHKQEHAERKKKGWWGCSGWCRRKWADISFQGGHAVKQTALHRHCKCNDKQRLFTNRQLVVPSISKGNV